MPSRSSVVGPGRMPPSRSAQRGHGREPSRGGSPPCRPPQPHRRGSRRVLTLVLAYHPHRAAARPGTAPSFSPLPWTSSLQKSGPPANVGRFSFARDRTRDGKGVPGASRATGGSAREAPAARAPRRLGSRGVLEAPAEPSRPRRARAHPLPRRPRARRRAPGRRAPGHRLGADRRRGARTAPLEPGGPRKDGRAEGFEPELRDGLPDGEVLHTLRGTPVLVGASRRHHGARMPHPAPGRQPPAPEVPLTRPSPGRPAHPRTRRPRGRRMPTSKTKPGSEPAGGRRVPGSPQPRA